MADTRKAAESTTANAFETTLSSQLGASDLTINVASTTGLASPCYIVVEPDSATQREYIFIDSTVAATSFTTTTTDNRYLSGSAAGSGLTHPSGSKVRVAPMKQHFEDIFDAIGKVVDTTYSSGTAGEVVLDVSAATVDVANDEIPIIDANDSNKVKKESVADIVSGIAGTGLTASSGQLNAEVLNDYSAGTVDQAADSIVFIDADDSNNSKKEAITDFVDAINGAGIDASSGTLVNAAIGKQSIWIPAAAMYPTQTSGCASITGVETTAGRPDMYVLDFDASSDENAQFSIAMPSYWNEGTITFQVYWTTTAADTDGVAWALSGVACSDNDTIDIAFGTEVVVTDDALGAAEDLCVTAESAAVTIAGTPAASDLAYFNIKRDVSDANDDMTEDARLIGVKIFYTVDDVHEA
jgi:hypothetical protein